MHAAVRRTAHLMGTMVTIEVLEPADGTTDAPDAGGSVSRAFAWFRQVEARCSRFDPQSELRQLCAQHGVAVPVSALLFDAVKFAVAVAETSGGAFDPAVGARMEARGFNRHHASGDITASGVDPAPSADYTDILLDEARSTVTLRRPMLLDLGAIAKGLAVDLAARELAPFPGCAIDAGGDLYLGGLNGNGAEWTIGIRHPRIDRGLIDAVRVSNMAVCTSGDYERPAATPGGGHHILDPRRGSSVSAVASVTVVAPTAMLADALATAAFVLGPVSGIELLERQGVNGLIVTPALERFSTRGMPSDAGASTLLPLP